MGLVEAGDGLMRRSAGRLAKWDCHSSPAGTNSKNASEALRGEEEGRKGGGWVKRRKKEEKKEGGEEREVKEESPAAWKAPEV